MPQPVILGIGGHFSAHRFVGIGCRGQALLTVSVQLGFVIGSLLSAKFNLADVLRTRRLMVIYALLAISGALLIALFSRHDPYSVQPA